MAQRAEKLMWHKGPRSVLLVTCTKGIEMAQRAEKLAEMSAIPGQRRSAMLSRSSPGERANTLCNNHRCGECLGIRVTQGVEKVAQRAWKIIYCLARTYLILLTLQWHPEARYNNHKRSPTSGTCDTFVWEASTSKSLAWLAPSCHPTN